MKKGYYLIQKGLYKILLFLGIKKKPTECLNDEYCPVYLAYLGKYPNEPSKVKYCKNSKGQYCTKYRLLADEDWKKMKIEKRIQYLKDLQIIDFIENIKDKKDRI